MFNIPGVYELNLTREAVVGIYNGTVTRWNDTMITDYNPELNLPSNKIRVRNDIQPTNHDEMNTCLQLDKVTTSGYYYT